MNRNEALSVWLEMEKVETSARNAYVKARKAFDERGFSCDAMAAEKLAVVANMREAMWRAASSVASEFYANYLLEA